MKTTAGVVKPSQLFRELSPGGTFRVDWEGKIGDYLVTDVSRAAPNSERPWDFRAAVNIESGTAIWLADTQMVAPTDMKAGPA
jgi:hypothetical protein